MPPHAPQQSYPQQGYPQQGAPNQAPTKRSPGRIIAGVLMLILGVMMLLAKLASLAARNSRSLSTSDSGYAAGYLVASLVWIGIAIALIFFGIRMFKARKR